MFSSLKKYESRGAKRQVRLFNRFRIESVLKIAPYHTLKFGGIGKLQYLCIITLRKQKHTSILLPKWRNPLIYWAFLDRRQTVSTCFVNGNMSQGWHSTA